MTDSREEQQQTARSATDISRRRLLRKAVTSAPLVLTLGGGAAMARSSLVLTASEGPAGDGNYYCVQGKLGDGDAYDYGVNPTAIYKYPDTAYKTEPGFDGESGSRDILGDEMCAKGGIFKIKGSSQRVDAGNGGFLISATAYESAAPGLTMFSSIDT